MTLELRGVGKRVGAEIHLHETSLTLASDGFNVLLGETGAGKTTLIKLMAGLEKPTSGRIFFDGRDVTDLTPQKRNVSLVHQFFINYPNLIGLREHRLAAARRRPSRAPRSSAASRETADLLHLTPMLGRRPQELSGGQQQRTALARAIVKSSDLVLLDEPLANLDYKLREEMRDQLPALFAGRGAIVVYATSEPSEALMLGGHTATIAEGRVTQFGPTHRLLPRARRPRHRPRLLRPADQRRPGREARRRDRPPRQRPLARHGRRWRASPTAPTPSRSARTSSRRAAAARARCRSTAWCRSPSSPAPRASRISRSAARPGWRSRTASTPTGSATPTSSTSTSATASTSPATGGGSPDGADRPQGAPPQLPAPTRADRRTTRCKTIDLEWHDGGAYALLGPSGCGKTTLLNIISGLIVPSEGQVLFDDRDVTRLAPTERNIAQVFQFPVIYDTMTVYDNLAFPLRNRGVAPAAVDARVRAIAEMLELGRMLARRASGLTADSKQKISMGRGLVREDVNVIMFDEPLTVIDPHLKWKLRSKLKELHQRVGATMIYVTHDQTEALTFADQVVVMQDGEVVQVGSPVDLFERPAHTFVGHFIGSPGMNILPCEIRDGAAFLAGRPVATANRGTGAGRPEIGVRPEFVSLGRRGASPPRSPASPTSAATGWSRREAGRPAASTRSCPRTTRSPPARRTSSSRPEQTRIYEDGWLAGAAR